MVNLSVDSNNTHPGKHFRILHDFHAFEKLPVKTIKLYIDNTKIHLYKMHLFDEHHVRITARDQSPHVWFIFVNVLKYINLMEWKFITYINYIVF